jgi:hypothetical protein
MLIMKFFIKFLFWLALLIGLAFAVKKYVDPSERIDLNSKTKSERVLSDDVFARRAFIVSQDFVTENLKSPLTADFPFLDYGFTRIGSNQILIKSYVDAQNSFGATIRNHYFIKMKYKGGEWEDSNNWEVIDLRFE